MSGNTTAKNTTVAMIRNEITVLTKDPYLNVELWKVKWRLEKLGLPKMAAMRGVMMSATNAVTMAVNATPTMMATARSTTFPRSTNFLKSENIDASQRIRCSAPFPSRRRTKPHVRSPRQESNPRHLHYK